MKPNEAATALKELREILNDLRAVGDNARYAEAIDCHVAFAEYLDDELMEIRMREKKKAGVKLPDAEPSSTADPDRR